MSICHSVCKVLKKVKVSAHLSIFAVPGVDAVNGGHGPASKCSSWASAHGKLPKQKNKTHTHTQWALLFLIYILILRDSGTSAWFTWGTRECPSRWRSPWVKHTSSYGCWWPPWRGSRTHRCPERPPAPAENQPQSTASWRSGTETVTGAAYSKHLKSKPSSLPPHLLLVFVCHLHHHLQVTVSTCCACNNMQGRMLFS